MPSRPLVGITSELIEDPKMGPHWGASHLLSQYAEGVAKAGGLPLLLPLADATDPASTLERLDGLVLSGGVPDIPAEVLGEAQHPSTNPMPMGRWMSEKEWLLAALETDLPILGICLGMQIMAVTAGGRVIQDVPSQVEGAQTHGDKTRLYRHHVEIDTDSRLGRIAPSTSVEIVSAHHQALANVPEPYVQVAHAADGVIEAMEDPSHAFRIGVQWHPERHPNQPDWLLQGFVRACGR